MSRSKLPLGVRAETWIVDPVLPPELEPLLQRRGLETSRNEARQDGVHLQYPEA